MEYDLENFGLFKQSINDVAVVVHQRLVVFLLDWFEFIKVNFLKLRNDLQDLCWFLVKKLQRSSFFITFNAVIIL